MPLPPLPTHQADTWEMGPAFEKTGSILSVSAHAGRVFAGGTELRRQRAGDQGWQRRGMPPEVGVAWKVAQEPAAPWRQAMSHEEGVTIFLGKEGTGRIARVLPARRDVYVTNLAWGRLGKRWVLYVLWDDGEVVYMDPDAATTEVLGPLPPMAALAGDGAGSIAMLAWEQTRVYVSDGSPQIVYRPIELERGWYEALPAMIEAPMHLAVAGKAVALSVGWEGAFLTRDVVNTPFSKCEPLSLAGALAFGGASADAPLFGAVHNEALSSIVRVDATGQAMRIGDLLPDKGAALPFDEIAWDTSRRSLFAVHRQGGLVVARAPDAKGARLAAPN